MKKVREGYKMTELGEIPEDWEVRSLIDISQGKGEYGIGAVATEYVVGNPRYLRITDIGDESRLLFNDIKGFDEDEYKKYLLKQNDIVFARTGNTTGKTYVYNSKDGELVYAGFLIKFGINPKIANVNFIKYIIQSKRYWDWVNVMSTRSGQPGINSNEYAKFIVQLPDVDEQQKIALILSSVDEQIEITDNIIEKIKELKKGLMQKLLTKGIGHSKFKDTEIGRIPEEWEVRKLGEIFKVSSGNFLSQKKIIAGPYPVYGGNGITGYHSEYLFEDSKIVIGRVGANCGCVCISENKSWITDNALFISDKINEFEDKYMFYLLTYLNLNQYANQNAQPVISGQKIYELKIAFPNKLEQQQISLILSSVAQQIEQYETKKEKLQQLKKGLMQKLLTGKIRVQ